MILNKKYKNIGQDLEVSRFTLDLVYFNKINWFIYYTKKTKLNIFNYIQ